MPKTKQEKGKIVEGLTDKLSQMKSAVFSDYYGLKVSEVEQLRKLLEEARSEYVVAKKTLLNLALNKIGVKEVDIKSLKGGVGVALSYQDEVAPARIIAKFLKEHKALKINGGILESKFIDPVRVNELAKLPSKEELIAKTVWTIKAPLSGLVNVMAGNLRGLVCVLNAVKNTKS